MDKNRIFNALVEKYTQELYSWAKYKVSSTETAQDLVQDTFLAAYKNFEGFNRNSSEKTWLFRILNNKIIDFYRKEKKSPFNEDTASVFTDSIFDETSGAWNKFESGAVWDEDEKHLLDNTEFLEILNFCLQDLPPKWNLALTSKFYTDKDSKEICQELDISPTNFWQIIHRSKLLLRKCLEKKWG